MKCAQTLEIGVYVLGALSPVEREAFERHLAECAVCREEVADLAVLPGLLGRLDPATAAEIARADDASALLDELPIDRSQRWAGPTVVSGEAATPAAWAGPTAARAEASGTDATRIGRPAPADGDGATVIPLLEAARRRRVKERRRRFTSTMLTALAAACLAVVVGFGVPRLIDSGTSADPKLVAMTPVAGFSDVAAEIGLVPSGSGTKVIMHCTYQGRGDHRWGFRLVVVPRAAKPAEEVGGWMAGAGDDLTLKTVSKYKPEEIAEIEMRNSEGKAVLTYTR
jgi:anti-sigma factor RsiW